MQQYFTERDYQRFGIEILEINGYNVSIWDLSTLICPQTIDQIKSSSEITDHTNIIQFDTFKSVLNDIYKEDHYTYFISTIPCTLKTLKIFIAITRIGCKYGYTGTYTKGIIPLQENISSLGKDVMTMKYIIKKVSDPNIIRILFSKLLTHLNKLYLQVSFRILKINYANYFAIIGGKNLSAAGPIINNHTYLHYIHSFDYDTFLLDNTNISEEYIVYIDQFMPFHPDFQLPKSKLEIEANQYYSDLRNFFELLETITSSTVIIAAHPKANYKGKEYLLGNRKYYQGFNSSKLISKAKLVLVHYSMAVNIAVLYRKPLVFLTSDLLNKTIIGEYIKNMANEFNAKPVNISQAILQQHICLSNLFKVNRTLYECYQHNYIKKQGTEEKLFWQQVADYIKQHIV